MEKRAGGEIQGWLISQGTLHLVSPHSLEHKGSTKNNNAVTAILELEIQHHKTAVNPYINFISEFKQVKM